MSFATASFFFVLSAAAVVLAGVRLARYGDIIAARTRLSGLWVGSVFLAFATSLPELGTDITAVAIGAPDLAAGDLFGSSMANMLVLALLSLLPRRDVFRRAAIDNGLSAALAIILAAMAGFFIVFRFPAPIAGLGPGSILLAIAYLTGTRAVFLTSSLARLAGRTEELGGEGNGSVEPNGRGRPAETARQTHDSVRRATAKFLIAALFIFIAAPIFALSARSLAERTGLGAGFFGTALVGLATSLPELVTSMTAVRMGAYDLAVGNLFGSNALNMVMFVPLDLVHPGRPLFGTISSDHALSALVGIVLMAIGLASILYRAKGRRTWLHARSALMLLVYLVGLLALYAHGHGGW